jgi:hypothetical protein
MIYSLDTESFAKYPLHQNRNQGNRGENAQLYLVWITKSPMNGSCFKGHGALQNAWYFVSSLLSLSLHKQLLRASVYDSLKISKTMPINMTKYLLLLFLYLTVQTAPQLASAQIIYIIFADLILSSYFIFSSPSWSSKLPIPPPLKCPSMPKSF